MFVLVIEDTPRDLAMVENALQEIGIPTITTVMDGGQAVELLTESIRKKEPLPDALLLDLNLPLVSGHEVLRFCRKTPELRQMKVIVLSRLASENEIQVCYYMGATRFILKTTDADHLQRELSSSLFNPDPVRDVG